LGPLDERIVAKIQTKVEHPFTPFTLGILFSVRRKPIA